MKVALLVIDPQHDFCDPSGSLFVPGADADMQRLATMVDRVGGKLHAIKTTLDSHHLVDIAHPLWWKDQAGNHPGFFTIITLADIDAGLWTTTKPWMFKRSREYVQSLETNGRYQLCIWPPHCLIGSPGQNVYAPLYDSYRRWEDQFNNVDYVTKGSNIWTEHYSAVKAEVPDPGDQSTQINSVLMKDLQQYDLLGVAGEAGSHCLLNTVVDIVNHIGDPSYVKKLCLLTDATSPVISPFVDFPALQDSFIKDMVAQGMQTATTTDWLT